MDADTILRIPYHLKSLSESLEIMDSMGNGKTVKQIIEEDYGEGIPTIITLYKEIEEGLNSYINYDFDEVFDLSASDMSYASTGRDYYIMAIVGYVVDLLYGRIGNVYKKSVVCIDKCVLLNTTISPCGGGITDVRIRHLQV